MDMEKRYRDSYGHMRHIRDMVKVEPEWAAVRIQAGEEAIKNLAALREAVDKVLDPWVIAGLVRKAVQEESGEDV